MAPYLSSSFFNFFQFFRLEKSRPFYFIPSEGTQGEETVGLSTELECA